MNEKDRVSAFGRWLQVHFEPSETLGFWYQREDGKVDYTKVYTIEDIYDNWLITFPGSDEETRMIAFLTWVGDNFEQGKYSFEWLLRDASDLDLSAFDTYDQKQLYSMWLKLNPAQ